MLTRPLFARSLAALAIAFVGLSALPAHATVMVELAMEQLIGSADVIVHARVLRSGTQLETFAGHLEPHTITELEVRDTLKGSPDERVTIDEIGGATDDGGSWIDGTPRYEAGDEVVVFLRRLPSAAYRTVGMSQGRFEVVHAIATSAGAPIARTIVERDTRTLAFASWIDGQMVVHDGAQSPSVDYDTFVGFVASVLDQLAIPSDPRTTGGPR